MSDLKDYISKNGKYLIPVEWSVYSTIEVSDVANLQEAIDRAKELIDVIPLCHTNEYIDGSYRISVDCDEDAINAQGYHTIGEVSIDREGVHN